MATRIHLVRHCEVENPENVWYGLLDGFPLSEAGRQRAQLLGDHFASHDLAAVYSSPMERAVQTAEPIASQHGLAVTTNQEIIEVLSYLQGQPADRRVLYKVRNLRYFINPLRPSWGEPYRSVAARMVRALEAIRIAHPEQEIVAVSHMTPIQVARLATEGKPLRPWTGGVPCTRGSVTTLVYERDAWVRTEYQEVGGPAVVP
ncbi:MAG TPA: histidine phosphatase family protein [Actinomycetota bacterium]|nr:histidine phosphatase family protein [Actinomycetota bacterium]